MDIIEYNDDYINSVKDLLVELQEYIALLDIDKYNIITDEYRDKYFDKTIKEVNKYEGKIFLAIKDNIVVGLIIGLINNEEESTYEFRAPKRGRITELIVKKEYRKYGIGQKLIDYMEEYFKSINCKAILLDVFSFNESAKEFYKKNGYYNRVEEMMKKL